jgi:repressor LexA
MRRNIDHEYLGKLQDYYARQKNLPSMGRLADLLGFSGTGGVFALVGRLKEAGYLAQGADRRLAPTEKFFERPMLGQVRAGLPEPAEEYAVGVNIDSHLVKLPTRTSLLQVRGDSMKDAAILDGDTVVVQKGAPAKPGDIVVAIVDNEFTVKYLDLDKEGNFFLRAGNAAFPPIKPKHALELYGVVVGSFRKY